MTSDFKRKHDPSPESSTKKPKTITDFFLVKKVNKVEKENHNPTIEKSQLSKTDNDNNQTKSSEQKTLNLSQSSVVQNDEDDDETYSKFCRNNNFDKEQWVMSLTEEEKTLLELEIKYLHITWLAMLHKTLTKPYFLNLKRFLKAQAHKTVFPPKHQIYSWSHLTPLPNIKCLILGQDPYHNFNQAHGLAFSVLEPTKPPPSLKNIYKGIEIDYPQFKPPPPTTTNGGGGGNITSWAKNGVLLLNTCLTVEAHKPNSHSKRGWEEFTHQVIDVAIQYHLKHKSTGFVVMAWGQPAQIALTKFETLTKSDKFLFLKTFHPSPFSAAKGFFSLQCFKKCNTWLKENGKPQINWSLTPNISTLN